MAFVKLVNKSELPGCGQVKEVYASGRFLCVANIDGEISVMDNVCPHWGGPLGRGRIENGQLVCPWHGWMFNPKTGRTPRNANLSVAVHRVAIRGDDVFAEILEAGTGATSTQSDPPYSIITKRKQGVTSAPAGENK